MLLQNVLILIPSPCANTEAKQFYIKIYSSSKTTSCQLWYHMSLTNLLRTVKEIKKMVKQDNLEFKTTTGDIKSYQLLNQNKDPGVNRPRGLGVTLGSQVIHE